MNGNRRASAKHGIELDAKARTLAADIFLASPPPSPRYPCKWRREGSIAIGEPAKPGRHSFDNRDRGGSVDGPADVGVLVVGVRHMVPMGRPSRFTGLGVVWGDGGASPALGSATGVLERPPIRSRFAFATETSGR
jgi:hypothetical protein